MTIQTKFTLEAELPSPMPAADLRAFLDAAEQSMGEVTVTTRPISGQMDTPTVMLTATGTAKPRPHVAHRGGKEPSC